ncbi:MAG: hypothetical protein J6B87_03280 [Clostridia bacterium]|nr:hypothetical protein [Clostridia bacterium]
MSKVTRKQKYKALDKLFGAGFKDDKSITNMRLKDMSKIEGLTKQEMDIIAEIQDAVIECKNINPLLEYLCTDDEEVEK